MIQLCQAVDNGERCGKPIAPEAQRRRVCAEHWRRLQAESLGPLMGFASLTAADLIAFGEKVGLPSPPAEVDLTLAAKIVHAAETHFDACFVVAPGQARLRVILPANLPEQAALAMRDAVTRHTDLIAWFIRSRGAVERALAVGETLN